MVNWNRLAGKYQRSVLADAHHYWYLELNCTNYPEWMDKDASFFI